MVERLCVEVINSQPECRGENPTTPRAQFSSPAKVACCTTPGGKLLPATAPSPRFLLLQLRHWQNMYRDIRSIAILFHDKYRGRNFQYRPTQLETSIQMFEIYLLMDSHYSSCQQIMYFLFSSRLLF